MSEQVVLVGLPGAGKSTAGRILADMLGWQFVDFDEVIEAEAQRTVAEIFTALGEKEFRRLEADLTKRLASLNRVVLAPGGGWVTNPELPTLLMQHAAMIWLRVRPETALVRVRASGVSRPLLQVPDALAHIARLLTERAMHYDRADYAIDTDDLTPQQIAESILEWLTRQNRNDSSS